MNRGESDMSLAAKSIMIVDDDPDFRRYLSSWLGKVYRIIEAECGDQALPLAKVEMPNLVLLDVNMPGLDGYETCRQLKASYLGGQTHVIIVSANSSASEQLRALEAGADDYIIKPIDRFELLSRIRVHFRLLDAQFRLGIVANGTASGDYHRFTTSAVDPITATQEIAAFTLAKLAESRDPETGEHLLRMSAYSRIIAEQLSLGGPYASQIDDNYIDMLYRSAPLHDIGKVAIGDSILLKPGKLTHEEFERMKQHAMIGANILEQAVFHSSSGSFLAMAAVIARGHHERFNGSGYPASLAGMEIPLCARIVALADVFDALTSQRPYKEPFPVDVARQMIIDESGKHFDPVIVEAFLARYDECVQLRERLADKASKTFGAMSYLSGSEVDLYQPLEPALS